MHISVRDLNKYYGINHVLKGVSFDIFEGETVGLLGGNGAGKTTVFRILSGVETYESGSVSMSSDVKSGILEQLPIYPSSYSVEDVLNSAFDELHLIANELKQMEKLLESDPTESLTKKYGELQHKYEFMGGYTIKMRIFMICNGLKIDDSMLKKKFEFLSGGEKARVNLGRILLTDTNLLLLDEPTNHLDIESTEWLEDFLGQYKGTAIIVSHDRYFLDKTIHKVIEIEHGIANVYTGNYSSFAAQKEEKQRLQLTQYEQMQRKVAKLEEAAKRMHDWGNRADNEAMHKRAFSIEKRIEKMQTIDKPLSEMKLKATFNEKGFSGRDIISLKNASKSYGSQKVLHNINLKVSKGSRIALIGKNGCGKTTLIKLITGQEKVDEGIARIGNSIKYALLEQKIEFEDPSLSVLNTIRHTFCVSEESARNMLAVFKFKGEDVFKTVENLSEGEKSRLQLCILMQDDINLLILDEPTNHLDITSREWIEEAVSSFGGTLLFISHDRYFINKYANIIWSLDNYAVTEYKGSYSEYKKWVEKCNSQISENVTPKIKPKKQSIHHQIKSDREKQAAKKQIERDIANLEKEISYIDAEMEEKACDADFVYKLFLKKEDLQKRLEELYNEWVKFEE